MIYTKLKLVISLLSYLGLQFAHP